MAGEQFNTWKEAALEAKRIAEAYDCTVQIEQEDSVFFVKLPEDVEAALEGERVGLEDAQREWDEEMNEEESLEQYSRDCAYDEGEANRELLAERSDSIEDAWRSSEDGWYYEE